MSRFRAGLVIGKFMPPHAGHLFLLERARERCASLSVILFTKPGEPIPGDLRAAWMRELCGDARLHVIGDDHPVNYGDAAAWDFWTAAIRRALPEPPDAVLSSERYGPELARRLGAEHVMIDADRLAVPISATQIRAEPMRHWERLPPCVRPYFVRRVAIVGAESTGKTTLARRLAERFATAWTPEFARGYLEARGGACKREDFPLIARGQCEAEDRAAREADRVLFGDTDLLTTCLWHEHYFGPPPPELLAAARARAAHLFLLCDGDTPWVADGLRDAPHARAWFQRRFTEELTARGAAVVALTGPWAKRGADAEAAVRRLIETPTVTPPTSPASGR